MPLEAPAAIHFSKTEVRNDGKKPYGVYVIQCKGRDGNVWVCEKRYSEFDALRRALLKDKCDKVKQLEALQHGKGKFPKKGGKSTDPTVMKARKEGLNVWLSSVMKYYGENLNVCAFFKEVAAIKRDVGLAQPPEGVPPVEPVRSSWPAGMEPEPDSEEKDLYSFTAPTPLSPSAETFGVDAPAEVETAPSGADEYIIGTHMMGSVNALCLPKPGLLVSVGADKGIQLWDLQAEKQLKRMENNRIIQCVVAMSETVIATGAEDGTIKTWDVDLNAVNEEGAVKKWSQRARKLNELSGHTGAVNGLDVFNDNMLISGSSDGTVCAWETDTGTQTVKLEGHEAAVNDVIKVDDSTIASCSADKTIRIWNFAPTEAGGSSLKATWEDAHKGQNVLCLIRISDSVIASGGGDFLAKVWDIGDGGTLAALKGHTSAVQSLAVIDDRILATGSADMTVRLWDIDKHYKLVKTVGAAKGGINFSINGLCAVSEERFASAADNVKIWSIVAEA